MASRRRTPAARSTGRRSTRACAGPGRGGTDAGAIDALLAESLPEHLGIEFPDPSVVGAAYRLFRHMPGHVRQHRGLGRLGTSESMITRPATESRCRAPTAAVTPPPILWPTMYGRADIPPASAAAITSSAQPSSGYRERTALSPWPDRSPHYRNRERDDPANPRHRHRDIAHNRHSALDSGW